MAACHVNLPLRILVGGLTGNPRARRWALVVCFTYEVEGGVMSRRPKLAEQYSATQPGVGEARAPTAAERPKAKREIEKSVSITIS